jgi:RNA polymerase sigma factor (sigma-70 family)
MTEIEKLLIEYDPLIVKLSKYNQVQGYDEEDLQQEFRMVFLKCYKNYDKTKGAKFDTYFITSCKNKVKKIKAKMYADKRPLIEYSLNRIDRETGLEMLQLYEDKRKQEYDDVLLQEIIDSLSTMEFGDLTMDYFFEEMTYEELSKKYEISVSKAYRKNINNLENLRKIYKN